MLEQQDELKKKKKKQEEEYDAAVKAAERSTIPENARPDQASAKAPAAKYIGAAGSGTTELGRLTDAVNRIDTRSNPYISDDDLWANQTRLDALKWEAEHPGVKKNEEDRVYDAIKAMDTEKNPMISDEDILANLDRLTALGGSWGAERPQPA